MEYAHDITMYWDLPTGLTFVLKFPGGTERVFHLVQQSQGYTYHVLIEDGAPYEEPLLGMTITYKTKFSTVIAKCIKRLEDEFSQYTEEAIKKNQNKTVYV